MSAAVSATISSMASSYQSEGAVTTTASGYLALLNEPDDTLRAIALTKLLSVVDVLWHEIAEALPDLEALAEDTETTSDTKVRQTAAAVASRVFFHLEEPQQALRLALLAGEEYFDAKSTSSQQQPTSSPYVERLISAAFDAYVKARKIEVGEIEVDTAAEKKTYEDDGLTVSALQPFVHRLLENSCSAGKYDHALGIAFEARETDKVQLILQQSGPSLPLLRYTLQTATTCIASKQFRIQTYQVIANLWLSVFQSSPKDRLIAGYDLVTVYQLLYQADKVGSVLLELLSSSIQEEVLAAYQLCFDLMDTADQAFIQQVAVHIVGDSVPIQQALRVLRGGFYSELALSFLYKQSNADRHIMETLKKSLEERSSGSRSSILHNASVMAHAYLYAGTTNDSFLRDYLDWMKKASNWYVRNDIT
jgi:26S proteasome regulatory subunit N2